MTKDQKIRIITEEFRRKFSSTMTIMMLLAILVGYILIVARGHLLVGIILMIGIILGGHYKPMNIKKEYIQKIADIEKIENETKGS